MEGRRCRTYSTSVWRLISQTDRTTSCVKRRGRQAYFHKGRLCYRERRSPRRSLRSSSKTGSRPHHAPPYPQRMKQTVPSRNGVLENQATLRHERVPAAAQTGDGTEPTADRDSQGAQATQQRPVQTATLHRESCVDKTCRQAVPRT